MSANKWNGPERRAGGDLETRIRDLEEDVRSGAKSRQAIHIRIGELDKKIETNDERINSKLDAIGTSVQTFLADSAQRAIDCAAHMGRTVVIENRWKTIKAAFWKAPTFATGLAAAAVVIWKAFAALVHFANNHPGTR